MADSIDDIISAVIEDEGGSKVTNDPKDKGGKTQYGISEASNPHTWVDGKVTEAEAREIYEQKYVRGPGFDKIPDSHSKLRYQLVDFGVLSGPMLAIEKLQAILGVKVDGVLGVNTFAAVLQEDPKVINNKLMVERAKMVGRIVSKNPVQAKFISGWLNRILDFISY
mgnify:CR=1 FL=1